MSKDLDTVILDFVSARNELKKKERALDRIKDEMYDMMDCNDLEEKTVETENLIIHITKVQPTKINWNIETLNSVLRSHDIRGVIKKSIMIDNLSGLKKFLKSHSVAFQDIRPFLNIEYDVNEKRIDDLNETGKLSNNEIKKCCKSVNNTKKRYYVVKEKNKDKK